MQSVYSAATAHWATGHSLWGGVLPLWCSQCILQPQPTGPQDTRCGGGGSYLSAEMQSVYSAATANWATGHVVGGGSPLCRDAVSVFCSHSPLGHRTLVVGGGVLPLCRDAVSVFCSHSQLGHRTLVVGGVLPLCRDAVSVFCSHSPLGHRTLVVGGVSYLSAEMQSVYSIAPAD